MPLPRPDIAYIPTPSEIISSALSLAKIVKGDVIYDLGCGDGRVAIAAAKTWGIRAVGIDIDPNRIQEAKQNAEAAGVERLVEFRLQNLFECDFSDASIIFIYLLPHLNLRLKPKLFHQLKPGTRIISRDFDMGDWQPDQLITVREIEEESTIYYWLIPPTNIYL
jgi:SAM-dependent methyltransferase